jgi:hypothetical protein
MCSCDMGSWGPEAIAEVFLHDVDPAVARASERYAGAPGAGMFAEPWPLAAWPDVSTRVLAPRADRLFPVSFQRRAGRSRVRDGRPAAGRSLSAACHWSQDATCDRFRRGAARERSARRPARLRPRRHRNLRARAAGRAMRGKSRCFEGAALGFVAESSPRLGHCREER